VNNIRLKSALVFMFKLVLAGLIAYGAGVFGLQTYFVAGIIGGFGVKCFEHFFLSSFSSDRDTATDP
jgi:small basic protein